MQILTLMLAAGAVFAHRPTEMVKAGRETDNRPAIVDFTTAGTWKTTTSTNVVAKVEYSTERAIFGEGACKITYRNLGGNEKPRVDFELPQAVALPEGADTVSMWIWGNNSYGNPADTGSVTVQMVFENAKGERTMWMFENVIHPRWKKCYLKLNNEYLRSRIFPGAKIVALGVHGMKNTADRFILLDWISAFKDEPQPISFAPRAKRGVQIFKDQPQGFNTGKGKLPFPNTERTVLPPKVERNPALEFRTPKSGADWSELAFRWQGGEWIPLAVGGGIFPETAAKTAKCRFFRDGDSLVCDIVRTEPGVEEVRFGHIGMAAAEAIPLPYWNYNEQGWTNRPAVVSVKLAAGNVFISATPDWTQSNASTMFAGRPKGGFAAANGGVKYLPKTDGTRNGCFERFVWTVSDEFDEVLPNIPNPTSIWKHVTGKVAWHALWENRVPYVVDHWQHAAGLGMTEIFASDYGFIWGDKRDTAIKYGEGPGWMATDVPESNGGDAKYAEMIRKIQETGVKYGLYNDYTDMSTYQKEWDEDVVSRNSDGSLQTAWAGCYAPKPAWICGACEKISPIAQRKFHFNGGYCDVHTCVTPWSRTDYDARVPGAGTFAATYYAYGEVLLLQKKFWEGPVYSEGRMHWMYAGLSDGNYAQDQDYDLPKNPWLVDFDLKRIHPLECDFGMGHNLDMFYVHGYPKELPAEQRVDRFLTATAAFGHPPYLIINWTNSRRSYYMLRELAAHYTQAEAVGIYYADAKGKLYPTSEAVVNGVYRRSQVAVRYSDGTAIVANGSLTDRMKVKVKGREIDLPPNSFWGLSGDGVAESMMTEIDGHRVEWARGKNYRYYNAKGKKTRFADGTETDDIEVRVQR